MGDMGRNVSLSRPGPVRLTCINPLFINAACEKKSSESQLIHTRLSFLPGRTCPVEQPSDLLTRYQAYFLPKQLIILLIHNDERRERRWGSQMQMDADDSNSLVS